MNINLIKNKNILKKIKAVVLPFILFLLLMIIFTFISYYANLSYSTISIITYIILVVSVSIAALWMSYLGEGRGWLNGIIGGVLFLALVFLTGLLVNGSDANILGFIYKLPLFIVVSLICGIIGINLK